MPEGLGDDETGGEGDGETVIHGEVVQVGVGKGVIVEVIFGCTVKEWDGVIVALSSGVRVCA